MSEPINIQDNIILFTRRCSNPYETHYGKCYRYFVTLTNTLTKQFVNYYYNDSLDNYTKDIEPDVDDILKYGLIFNQSELNKIFM